LDHFLRRLFGVLSQPGFSSTETWIPSSGRHDRRLRSQIPLAMEPGHLEVDRPEFDMGREYLKLLDDGVIAATSTTTLPIDDDQTVLLAPVHAFLMLNRPVRAQIWLDIGSSGWYERLAQPLTHPHVLSRGWPLGKPWTDADEQRSGQETMARVLSALLLRCKDLVVLGV
jgi:hypothetical protein